MAKVITITNQKGGVGKTTVSTNIAFSLQELMFSVLFIDLDSQGHSSIYISGDKTIAGQSGGAERIFEANENLRGIKTASGIELLHGHRDLGRLDSGEKTSEDALNLRAYIKSLPYDFIIIDTPPALQLRQFAAIAWSDLLLIVTEAEEKSLRGFLKVVEVIKVLKEKNILPADYAWRLLFNRYDKRLKAQEIIFDQFVETYKESIVPIKLLERKSIINQSFSARIPVWQHKDARKTFKEMWKNLPHTIGIL
jgi:chromosome partitioning protein